MRPVFNTRGNTNPIGFTFTLKMSNIPGGDLTFNFAIGNTDGVQNEKLDYGNEVKLTSQVVDKITKKAAVFAGAGKSTIYLALRHQGGKSVCLWN